MQPNHPALLQQLSAQRAEELRAAGRSTRRARATSRGALGRRFGPGPSLGRVLAAWRQPTA
jgi:hypothetical protein